jgi:hypothetical protein
MNITERTRIALGLEIPKCKDCKWYRESFDEHPDRKGDVVHEPMCISADAHGPHWQSKGNIIWGMYARLNRNERKCKPEGIYWEPRDGQS